MTYRFSRNFPQKRCFTTGAASGLGRALALELAADQWTIGISDINQSELDETAVLIEKAGGKAISYTLDVADEKSYENISQDFIEQCGGIDLLINNAGVGDGGLFEDYSLENWNWIIGINFMGVVHGCHYFVPHFKRQKSGHIINVASIAAIVAGPRMAGYNSTKAAVKALSETLYSELKEFDVGVSVLMPFFFRTKIMQYSRGDAESKESGTYMVEGATTTAQEVAQTTLKLAARKKLYITTPFAASLYFHFQRFFPRLHMRLNAWMARNQDTLTAQAKKQYLKQKEKSAK